MAKSEEKSEETVRGKRRAEPEKKVAASSTLRSVRSGVATAVWLLAVLAAVILAAGALVVTLDFNTDNPIVEFFRDTAYNIDFGTFKKFDAGKSADAQQDALVKTRLVSWGIAAVIYLVAGKLLERLIRP